jgi:hypothetical protein
LEPVQLFVVVDVGVLCSTLLHLQLKLEEGFFKI